MRLAASLVLLLCLSLPAAAQDCSIGTYSNPAGLLYDSFPTPLELTSFWVLIFAEDTAAAAAYSIEIPSDILVQGYLWAGLSQWEKSLVASMPFWIGRAVFGTMIVVGQILQAYNMWMTARAGEPLQTSES